MVWPPYIFTEEPPHCLRPHAPIVLRRPLVSGAPASDPDRALPVRSSWLFVAAHALHGRIAGNLSTRLRTGTRRRVRRVVSGCCPDVSAVFVVQRGKRAQARELAGVLLAYI